IWLTSFLRSPLLTAAIRAERVTPSAYHLFPQIITIGGWHGYCIASLLLPLDVLMQFGSAIPQPQHQGPYEAPAATSSRGRAQAAGTSLSAPNPAIVGATQPWLLAIPSEVSGI
ncbi:MAG: hypothetical protein BRC35_01050, partial [Cyanobacteria bacterium QH_10_48_56]